MNVHTRWVQFWTAVCNTPHSLGGMGVGEGEAHLGAVGELVILGNSAGGGSVQGPLPKVSTVHLAELKRPPLPGRGARTRLSRCIGAASPGLGAQDRVESVVQQGTGHLQASTLSESARSHGP